MEKLLEIKNGLKGLLEKVTDTSLAEQIGKLGAKVDEAEKEEQGLIASHEDLRKKYIEAIKDTSFAGAPKPTIPEDNQPKSFEEILEAQSKKDK